LRSDNSVGFDNFLFPKSFLNLYFGTITGG
jgi:hypothetical protein